MEVRIPEEGYQVLRHIAEKQNLSENDLKHLSTVLQKVGVVLNLKEYVAIRYDNSIKILCPGMVITINVDVYEKSIMLGLNVENSLNFSTLAIEVFPEPKDELKEFIDKMKMKSGGYPLDD